MKYNKGIYGLLYGIYKGLYIFILQFLLTPFRYTTNLKKKTTLKTYRVAMETFCKWQIIIEYIYNSIATNEENVHSEQFLFLGITFSNVVCFSCVKCVLKGERDTFISNRSKKFWNEIRTVVYRYWSMYVFCVALFVCWFCLSVYRCRLAWPETFMYLFVSSLTLFQITG